MELKSLPIDIALLLSQWLENADLLSLVATSVEVEALFSYQPFWVLRAQKCGIYQPEYESLSSSEIKVKLVHHMKHVYEQIRAVCPKNAKKLANIVIEDDPIELQLQVLKSAKQTAIVLLPIIMKFGRVRIMHSLFNHFNIPGSFHWLIHAIRHEHYLAVEYLVEIKSVPLITDAPWALLASINRLWDSSYPIFSGSSQRGRATFRHYNELLLREILRCRDPKIVCYLKAKINALLEEGRVNVPDRSLLALLNRHSADMTELMQNTAVRDFAQPRL